MSSEQKSDALLRVTDLTISFSTSRGRATAVEDVSLELHRGKRLAIVGESGSGKSTMASTIHRLLPNNARIESGSVLFGGQDLLKLPMADVVAMRGRRIGYVPQDPLSNLDPVQRVGTQLVEAFRIGYPRATRAELQRHAVDALARVGIPDPERRIHQYPHEFSGGMRQRALIAMGMACRPELLIADEPTSALDVTVQRRILDLIDDLTREQGTALLFITHDLGLAAERADDVVVMQRGQTVERGRAEAVLEAPKHPYTKTLIAAAPNLASRRLVEGDEPVDPAQEPLLEVRRVSKTFSVRARGFRRGGSQLTAVDDVSLSVAPGRTVSIVGESGSGKSTTARIVLDLERSTTGEVLFRGRSITQLDRAGRFDFRSHAHPVFQNPFASLDPRFTVGRSIREPLDVHRHGDGRARRARVEALLDLVALPADLADRYPHELSGGQRQRVAIARALALDPRLVVLDEAVSALDVVVQAQILQLLVRLQRELGLAYLFVSHDLAVVRQISHTVHVMQAGRIVESGTPDEIFEAPKDPYTKALLDAIPGREVAAITPFTGPISVPERLSLDRPGT